MKKLFTGLVTGLMTGLAAIMLLSVGAKAQTFFTDFTSFQNATVNLMTNDFSTAVDLGTTITFAGGQFDSPSADINQIASESLSAGVSLFANLFNTNTFTLNVPVTAFGIFIGDLGDLVPSNLSVNGVQLVTGFDNANPDASLDPFVPADSVLFVGVINPVAFSSVTISGNINGDFIGFDNLTTGSIAVIPEPATWLMMIIGFVVIGLASRRRRRFIEA